MVNRVLYASGEIAYVDMMTPRMRHRLAGCGRCRSKPRHDARHTVLARYPSHRGGEQNPSGYSRSNT